MLNKIYEIKLSTVSIGGNHCKNFEVIFEEPYCAGVKCAYNPTTKTIVVSVPPDCSDSCIYANIRCLDTSNCSFCPDSERIKICPCTVKSDCQDCETCDNGLCITECVGGEFCKNDTCIECDEENPCPNGQVCNNGTCECPPGKPYIDEDGICVACIEGTVIDCAICKNGIWVDKECKEGVCDPDTDDCVDCLKSGDCEKNNECCVDKDCVCCPGFIRNLVTGECNPAPDCTKDSDCDECEICTDLGCQPVVCPPGFICVGGDCLPECDCSTGDCDKPGSSCVPHPTIPNKCYCKNCEQFDCDTCQDEYGCDCTNDTNCVPDDACDLGNLSLEWKFIGGTNGTPNGSAAALALVSTIINPLQQVYNNGTNSTYRNYEFTVQIANNNSGQWFYTNGLVTQALPSTGNTISVTLEGLQQNLGFFALRFVDNSPCSRTITIPFAPNTQISNPLQAATNGWVSLTPDNSGGCNAYTGGTPGEWYLCVKESTDFVIDPSSLDIITTDSISISLAPQVGSCSKATITGCGEATGTVDVICKGVTQTVDIPFFEVDQNCCDPYDPSCVTTGEPCDTINQVNLPLEIYPLFGTNGTGTTSEAVAIVDALTLFNSGTFNVNTFLQLASKMCWSSEGNVDSNTTNEVVTEGNSFGVGFQNPFEFKFDYEVGTCILVGHSCDIIINCKQYKGKKCIDACEDFEVIFSETNIDNEYFVIPSNFGYVTGNEDWTLRGFTSTGSTTPTLSVTLQPATATLPQIIGSGTPGVGFTVLQYFTDVLKVSIQTKIKKMTANIVLAECEGDGTLIRFLRGCTNPLSCNYDRDADLDDGSCEILSTNFSYGCNGDGLGVTVLLNGIAHTGFTILDGNIVRNEGDILPSGTYNLRVSIGDCMSSIQSLTVDCCANSNLNVSGLTTVCDNGAGSSTISFTVGGGNGPYTLDLLNSSNVVVQTLAGETAGAKTMLTGVVLTDQSQYSIRVTDLNGCMTTRVFTFLCCTVPTDIHFDDGAGGNPSAISTGNNSLQSMNGQYPSSGSPSVCGGITPTMFLQSTANALTGKTIIVTPINDVSITYDGVALITGSPNTIVADDSKPFVFTFANESGGSSSLRLEYCGTVRTFNFIHDCSASVLTHDQFFIANEDASGSIGFIKVTMNNTATSIINLETLYQGIRYYSDIAYLNNTLYTIRGPLLQDVTELGVGLNISYDISLAVNGGLLSAGACAIPGSDIILLVASDGTGAQIGYTNVLTQTNTFVEEIPGLFEGYDIVVNGNDVYISGRGLGGPTDYKVYKMALIGNVLQPGSTVVVNTITKNIKGSTLLTPSGGGVRYLGAGDEATPTTNTSIYFTTDIENNGWVLQTNSGPIQGSITGMASRNG